MFKRISLFLLINLAIVLTLSAIISLLGIQPYLSAYGIDYQSLVLFSTIWGTGGAFISLLSSKWVAKQFLGVQVINPNAMLTSNGRALLALIERLSNQLKIPMPEVGIYTAQELNAFAKLHLLSKMHLLLFQQGC